MQKGCFLCEMLNELVVEVVEAFQTTKVQASISV